MKRISVLDKNISPNQRRLRLMELSGIPISDKQKERLQPRKELLNEIGIMLPVREIDVIGSHDPMDELHDVKISKGYKEGRKLVDKLRRDLFRKLNDDELEDFMGVLKTSFGFK